MSSMVSNVRTPGSTQSNISISAAHLPNNADHMSYSLKLLIEQDLDTMTQDWSATENDDGRRLVKFHIFKVDRGHNLIRFSSIQKAHYNVQDLIISCIYWKEANLFIVTSVDIIILLENLIQRSFTIEEKNRIRRNLQSLKPYTISKTNKDDQRFFSLIMSMENPRPRNIEKDLKVFKWSDLYTALNKVVSKYSFSSGKLDYSSHPITRAETNLPKLKHSSGEEVVSGESKPSVTNMPKEIFLSHPGLEQIFRRNDPAALVSAQALDARNDIYDKHMSSNGLLSKINVRSISEQPLGTYQAQIASQLTKNLAKTISKIKPTENYYPQHLMPIVGKGSIDSFESSDSLNTKAEVSELYEDKGHLKDMQESLSWEITSTPSSNVDSNFNSISIYNSNSELNSVGSSNSSVDVSANQECAPSKLKSLAKTGGSDIFPLNLEAFQTLHREKQYVDLPSENSQDSIFSNVGKARAKNVNLLPPLLRKLDDANKPGSYKPQLPPLKKVNTSGRRHKGILPSPRDIIFNIEEYRKKSNSQRDSVLREV